MSKHLGGVLLVLVMVAGPATASPPSAVGTADRPELSASRVLELTHEVETELQNKRRQRA